MDEDKKKARKYCSVYNCMNTDCDPNLTFFKLPKDDKRRRKWLALIDREELLQKENMNWISYLVCSAHFEDSCMKTVKHLKADAMPSLLLPNQPQAGSSYLETASTSSNEGSTCSDEKSTSALIKEINKGRVRRDRDKKKAKKYCAVFNCLNKDCDSKFTFFKLPKDDERRRKWLELIDRQELLQKENANWKSYLVCSAHFEDSCIKTFKHLKNNPLPSLNLPNRRHEDSYLETASTSSTEDSTCSDEQSTSLIENTGNCKVIILSNSEEYATVATQTEPLVVRSKKHQIYTSNSFTSNTQRKRKLSN